MADNQSNKRQHDDTKDEQPEKQTKRARFDYDYNNVITVLVDCDDFDVIDGEDYEPDTFTVHKDTICEKSKFFEAACSAQWKEGQEKLVRLHDILLPDFRTYVHWVYTGMLSPQVRYGRGDVKNHEVSHTCMMAYITADILDDAELRTHALKLLEDSIDNSEYLPSGEIITRVWSQTPKGSPLRALLVEWIYFKLTSSLFKYGVSRYPKEFLEELAVVPMHEIMSYPRMRKVWKRHQNKEIKLRVLYKERGGSPVSSDSD